MSTSRQLANATNATLDDCVRLWTTLVAEYIPGLKIEMTPGKNPDGAPVVVLELVDYSSLAENTGLHRSVWSRKQFFSPLYLISHTQLFDLLIVGYRVIDEYFRTGKDRRPSPL